MTTDSRAREQSLRESMQQFVDSGAIAGAAMLMWREGEREEVACVGARDLSTSLPVERDTIFRIASMSKPVTAVAALIQAERGRFGLDEPIARYAPEFADMRVLVDADGPLDQTVAAGRLITFRDLLTH